MTGTVDGQTLLRTDQVAAAYGIAEYLIKDAIKDGDIAYHQVGRQKLMVRQDVENWIVKKPVGGTH